MTNYRKISYEAPELEVHPITLERGFAASDPWGGGAACIRILSSGRRRLLTIKNRKNMKNGMKYTVCIAAAAMAFGGCVKTDEQSAIPSSAGKVAVSFAAQSEHIGVGSRAAIDEG